MKMDPTVEAVLQPLRSDVKEQGDLVRKLKEENAPKIDIDAAVRVLKEKRRILEAKEAEFVPKDTFEVVSRLADVNKRRRFYKIGGSIHFPVAGLIDYGSNGVALKKNILRMWEDHFVLGMNLRSTETTLLTHENVLKASGHVEKFTDLMVKDIGTGDCHRLDHLIKNHLEKLATEKGCSEATKQKITDELAKLDGFSVEELMQMIKEYQIKSPATGNELSDPIEFNLMISTLIGPEGSIKCYLRPETAQGIFVSFKDLLEDNRGRLPFGVTQIGKAFRNEISPRGGLIRMREFTMAEIEYFVDPENKKHSDFDSIKNMSLNLYSARNQMEGEPPKMTTMDEAVSSGVVANETIAYFLAAINSFVHAIGMDPNKIRFRQHMSNEMAHYASDCWDCELLTNFGWLECVGCADRGCFDLVQHSKAANVKLAAKRRLDSPKEIEVADIVIQKANLGKALKGAAQAAIEKINDLKSDEQINQWERELSEGGFNISLNDSDAPVKITSEMASIRRVKKTIQEEEFVPHVIEPSFGIDRLVYALMEHNFKIREDDPLKTYFSYPATVAPCKCAVLPLSNNKVFYPYLEQLFKDLRKEKVSYECDDSAVSIGKRYARADEIGTPYAITIDFDTTKENSVTLRHCISTEQIRVDIDKIANLIRCLSTGEMSWDQAKEKWPLFTGQSETAS